MSSHTLPTGIHSSQVISRRPHIAFACIRSTCVRAPVTSLRRPGAANNAKFVRSLTSASANNRSRLLLPTIRASLPDDAAGPTDNSHIPLPYAPFSAELLLAVARLGHLERYRQEVAMFHEPGGAADLTRCALLITNIFQPQLDHRPYYERLEDMVARAALAALAPPNTTNNNNNLADASSSSTGEDIDDEPSSLDPSRPEDLLRAIRGINSVVFGEEGLADNAADPHDPLNGSLADVMDTQRGNQYSLAVVYLHIAEALGLPCAVVGSTEHILIRQLLAGMKLSLLLSGRQEEALAVIRYLRATDPFSLPDLRDEALALANAQQYEQAGQLCREYLAVAPGAPDAGMVGEVLLQVQLAAEVARARARKQRG
ncbi:hypothetical protein OEZ85_008080 [Tetradesmus obliquus]|uniref:Protein SirB1 N-terminal domain-containing protein n=1 Tax=Tetradesmus obliquus TaxID=3088 RepID=A0ABY8THU8_TETOB|nr:hypothetical protein OEZ85_008080 [Tetradesmus obliquus]